MYSQSDCIIYLYMYYTVYSVVVVTVVMCVYYENQFLSV